jgi:2-C-methyl-D-erythritol 4-phosphate cytidylyltransferase
MNISVILSGGNGTRFGGELPKQYQLLNGKEVISYVVDALMKSKATDQIVIVSAEPLVYDTDYAHGGNTHNESARNALDYIARRYANCEKVVFVDSARPFINAETIDKVYKYLDDVDAVITAQHIADSLGKDGEQYIDRSKYFLIQKPEAFRFEQLYKVFSATSETTAIVQQMPPDSKVLKHYETGLNMKITYPQDLQIAEYLMKLRSEHL